MKTRNLVFLFLAVILVMGLGSAVARAEGDIEGDIYTLNDKDYPTRHWKLMTFEEVKAYIDAEWETYTGELWFHQEADGSLTYVGDPPAVSLDQVQDQLYNNGWRLVVLYNWRHDGPSLGKHSEQTVSVGYWILDAVQAAEFMATYETPELYLDEAEPAKGYYSSWYLDSQSAMDPSGEESRLVLDLFSFVREEYDVYDRGYGEQVVLKNGNTLVYTFDEAVASGGFDDELWPLK